MAYYLDGAKLITQNRIPILFLLVLFFQFLLIIFERILWLKRAIGIKLVAHYVLVLFFHLWLFVYLPLKDQMAFIRSPSLIVFYICKCWYFYYSAKQIAAGYPLISVNSLTVGYSLPQYILFQLYRAIPFVYELRTLLDWTCLPTTLDWFQWLTLEDIYADLFAVQCRNESYQRDDRKFGQTQRLFSKLLIGKNSRIQTFCIFIHRVLYSQFPFLKVLESFLGSSLSYGSLYSFSLEPIRLSPPILWSKLKCRSVSMALKLSSPPP